MLCDLAQTCFGTGKRDLSIIIHINIHIEIQNDKFLILDFSFVSRIERGFNVGIKIFSINNKNKLALAYFKLGSDEGDCLLFCLISIFFIKIHSSKMETIKIESILQLYQAFIMLQVWSWSHPRNTHRK